MDMRSSDRLGPPAFVSALRRFDAVHVRRASFAASNLTAQEVEPLGDVLLSDRDTEGFDLVLELDADTLAHVHVWRGRGRLVIGSRNRDAVDGVTDDLVRCLDDPQLPDHRVPVVFWSATAGGYTSTSRRELDAPSWDSISDNYAPSTASALGELMPASGPGAGGLLLWHGPPGTGKSFAVRALARAWRGWCDAHVITDPELFFNASTDYLVSGLLRQEDNERWRLFVVEDSGEYLAADARAVAGQAVSRILNLTDGLLGAGLRSLVLVTTNEPIRRVHPALARPGRCWAQVDFAALPADQANVWLRDHGCEATVEHAATLAELYALRRGARVVAASPVGFAGGRTAAG